MDKNLITRNLSLHGNDTVSKRGEIKEYFLKTYELFERSFGIFKDESVFYEQPIPLRHQLIFYYGHTAAFYINKLILGKFIKKRVNPKYESMFAIGVDEMSWDDLNQENYNWPSVKKTKEYREKVKEIVCEYIDNMKFSLPIGWDSPMWPIIMGCEHERIHLETSSVLHRQLDLVSIKHTPLFNECKEYGDAPKNELIEVKGASLTLGKKDDKFYGWDNEYGKKEIEVEDFKAAKYLVSNGEFLEFVMNGGYKDNSYWDKEGKAWKKYTKTTHPEFWIKEGESFKYRTITNIIDLPMNWPVDVNYLEAKAFCNYLSKKLGKNITLPSEAMWYRLHETSGLEDEPNWEEKAPANINLEHFTSACPVNKFKHGEFYDVIGNVWQWTSTPIESFEEFKVHPLYDDFSIPTFDKKHNLIKGGSFISTGNETLLSSRYAFRRHFFQHAGFRYVEIFKEIEHIEDSSNNELLFEDIKFYNAVSNYVKKFIKPEYKKALNLGCHYGKIPFKLKDLFENITGIDFTARNIQIAEQNLDIAGFKNIEFWQGDSCNLKPHFKGFDMIIATNEINELYNIQSFCQEIPNRLNKKGKLVIAFKNSIDQSLLFDLLCENFKAVDKGESFSVWIKK